MESLPVFVPLHVKSDYSFGCGTASVDELVDRAAAYGFSALGLTDIENLCGQIRFQHQCRARGLHPITGIELRPDFNRRGNIGRPTGRLVLLAENRSGYRSLCRIVSRRQGVAATQHPQAASERGLVWRVAREADGLFALSDDVKVLELLIESGAFPLQKLKLLVIRPQRAGAVSRPQEAAGRLGIRMLADIDTVFLDQTDHSLHLLQLAVKKRILLEEASRDPAAESSLRRLRSPDEVTALFSDLPEALAESAAVAESCRLELGGQVSFFSGTASPAEKESARRLRVRCMQAVGKGRERAPFWSPDHEHRLEMELATFERMSFSSLFDSIGEILCYCRSQSIPVRARGSAVSSLVLHLLGGSPVDPLAQGLLFERFLNEAKPEYPDVDLDLPYDRRDEVIGWVYNRFGRKNVAMVAAHHRFQHRSALREGLTALGARPMEIAALIRRLPPEELTREDADLPELFRNLQDIHSQRLPEPWVKNLELVGRLVERPHHVAAHPGGIVVGRTPLEDLLPLERAPKGVVITQYDMAAAAAIGLIKIDLLGNRCLTELEETLRIAGVDTGLEGIPPDDPSAIALIDHADTIGCFQLETPAMRSLLARIPVRRRTDIVAALALIRPGAAAGAAKEVFVARSRGEAALELFDPIIADRIGETQGLLLYEEDIMVLLSRIGGLSMGEADQLRSDIVRSAADPDIVAALEAEFLMKARSRRGQGSMDPARARRAFAAAVRFSAYSFNRAHAVSYGELAYLSAYMKAHYPVEFACALINHHEGLYPRRTLAAELIRSGIAIRPAHVNFSDYRSSLQEGPHTSGAEIVRVGLDKLKNLSHRSALRLLASRSGSGLFVGLDDLIERVHPTIRELEALILSGACDGISPLNADRYPFPHMLALETIRHEKKPIDPECTALPEKPAGHPRLELYQNLVRVQNELRYLEMHLTHHPVALLRPEAEDFGCIPIRTALVSEDERSHRLLALVAAMRRVPSRQGVMQFLTLEDETGLLEGAVAPQAYARMGNQVTTPGPFLVTGTVRKRQDAVQIEVSELLPFYERRRPPR